VEFPGAVAVDHVDQRLFVVDSGTGAGFPVVGSQIMVFDIHPDRIETGSSVIAVLGQPDVDTKTLGLAANHISHARSVVVDDAGQRLFVGGRIILPWFFDGPTITTQFFVLSKGDTPAKGMIEFFDWKGTALPVVLR